MPLPVLGTATTAKARAGRNDRVLPNAAFATDRWSNMDMDLKFSGLRVIRPDSLPLEDLSVHAMLDDAVLRLEPLHFGVAKGQIESKLVLDSRKRPLTVRMDTRVQLAADSRYIGWDILCLGRAAAGERFDLILSNPPDRKSVV